MKQQNALTKLSTLFEKSGVTEANVIVSKERYNLKPNLEFGMIFPKVIRVLIKDCNLTTSEINTLMTVFDMMAFNNMFSLSQQAIANEVGISKQAVSKHFKKFYDIGILHKDGCGAIWVNPIIFAKGKLWDFKNNKIIYREVEELSKNLGLEEPPF